MKDIFKVLRERELDVIRVQREIAALRVVTSLLAEECDRIDNEPPTPPQFAATGTARRA
jgi:hypothetical protein